MKNKQFKLECSCTLTIASETFTETGLIVFHKGDKVTVYSIDTTKARWSHFFNMWLPERTNGVRILENEGIWSLMAFEETRTITKI